jgi:hypothetical protein
VVQIHSPRPLIFLESNTRSHFQNWLGFDFRSIRSNNGIFGRKLEALCLCWLKHEEGEEEPITVQKYSREGYNLAALLFFLLVFGQPVATR